VGSFLDSAEEIRDREKGPSGKAHSQKKKLEKDKNKGLKMEWTPEKVAEALDDITMKALGESWDRRATEGECRRTHEAKLRRFLSTAGLQIPNNAVMHYFDSIYGHNGALNPLTMEKAGVYEERSAMQAVQDTILEVVFPGYKR
jgi:hypothetical protein